MFSLFLLIINRQVSELIRQNGATHLEEEDSYLCHNLILLLSSRLDFELISFKLKNLIG